MMDNELCDFCNSISSAPPTPSSTGFVHRPTIGDLKEYRKKCPLCAMLWLTLKQKYDKMKHAIPTEYPASFSEACSGFPFRVYALRIQDRAKGFPAQRLGLSHIYVGYSEEVPNIPPSTRRVSSLFDGELTLFADRNDSGATLFSNRRLSTDAGSDDTFQLVQSWVERCDKYHQSSCTLNAKEIAEIAYPTRLIDVGLPDGSQEPKLYVPQDPPTRRPYTALSYVWGSLEKTTHFTTTSATVDRRIDMMRMRDLPTTIRDAVTITRKLDVRYLWVDALCIMQDEDEEKEKEKEAEMNKMKDYYSGAMLTIVAAAANSMWGGIHSYPRQPEPPHCRWNSGFASMREFKDPTEQPWYKRAWTLQERFLARRLLIYHADEVSWECQCCYATESGRELPQAGRLRLTDGTQHSNWGHIVEEYSSRNMSYSGDKLGAIAGVAQAFASQTKKTYISGLWKEDLCDGLIWRHEHMLMFPVTERRRYEGRAPSWSWASLDGNILYRLGSREHSHISNDVNYDKIPEDKRYTQQCSWIELEGPLLEGPLSPEGEIQGRFSLGAGGVGAAWMDMEEKDVPAEPTSGLLFVKGEAGLVLKLAQRQPPEEYQQYERIGVFRLVEYIPEYVRSLPRKKIRIV